MNKFNEVQPYSSQSQYGLTKTEMTWSLSVNIIFSLNHDDSSMVHRLVNNIFKNIYNQVHYFLKKKTLS